MKAELSDYIGKNVEIIDLDGWKFIGRLVCLDDIEEKNNKCSYQVKTKAVAFDIIESEVKSIREIEINCESLRLWEYVRKEIKLYLLNGKVLTGKAIDFDDEMDNASGYDSIYIKTNEGSFDIDEYEIKSINEID
jgi:small nuclear ribonucleoprotein (snRNP)-like protein